MDTVLLYSSASAHPEAMTPSLASAHPGSMVAIYRVGIPANPPSSVVSKTICAKA
jgi:hypothetical protein